MWTIFFNCYVSRVLALFCSLLGLRSRTHELEPHNWIVKSDVKTRHENKKIDRKLIQYNNNNNNSIDWLTVKDIEKWRDKEREGWKIQRERSLQVRSKIDAYAHIHSHSNRANHLITAAGAATVDRQTSDKRSIQVHSFNLSRLYFYLHTLTHSLTHSLLSVLCLFLTFCLFQFCFSFRFFLFLLISMAFSCRIFIALALCSYSTRSLFSIAECIYIGLFRCWFFVCAFSLSRSFMLTSSYALTC